MTAISKRRQAEATDQTSVPDYERIEHTVLAWPQEAQVKLMHKVLNRLVPEKTKAAINGANAMNALNTEQPGHGGNILDIVGRWDFAYDIEDDELKQMLGEARMEKYAPELLPEMRAQWESDRLTRKRLDEQARLARKMGILGDEEKEDQEDDDESAT